MSPLNNATVFLPSKGLNPLADFFFPHLFADDFFPPPNKMAGYGGHSLFCLVWFLQCGNHSQTGFWDYKRYLLDPVCIFIVFVNSVMTPFLNVLGMFTAPNPRIFPRRQ